MHTESLISLFKSVFGQSPVSVTMMPGAGSDRRYYRLMSPNDSAIGCVGTSKEENRRFIDYDRFFRAGGARVPEIYAVSESGMEYLMQDLGDISLFSLLGEPETSRYVAATLRDLADIQTMPGAADMASHYSVPFGKRLVMFDLNYFKYCFLKPAGIVFDEYALEVDFSRLASEICSVPDYMQGFMYRDCQSRNVMIHDEKPWWIDFQGGMAGPCAYDAASFLWQARAGFSDDFRNEMIDVYSEAMMLTRGGTAKEWHDAVKKMAAFRTLQVLGAYGFRGLVEKKAHFVVSIPGGIANLRGLLDSFREYPELEKACRGICDSERFKIPAKDEGLCVSVFSFSYKKGYPEDLSGNGGGFMFDCRAMHNPGRCDEYKSLTGMDKPVVDFLEERGEVQEFLDDLLPPVERAVERYRSRGFTSLQVGFGCTGGQHRSVYCAQKTAEHLARLFPDVKIRLIHREQGVDRIVKVENKN